VAIPTNIPLEYLNDVEENFCVSCRFRKNPEVDGEHAVDYPMCWEIEGAFLILEKVEELDITDTHEIICKKFRDGDPWETFGEHPDQPELF
jgi:hypothetical protein